MASVSRGRATAVSYVDSLCLWSPTGEHVYQLAYLDQGMDRRTLVDKCRHCGDLAFHPRVTARADAPRSRWRLTRCDSGGVKLLPRLRKGSSHKSSHDGI